MTSIPNRIEIFPEGDPEPVAGSVRFECRCGFVIDSADFPPRTMAMQPDRYEQARKDHKAACPMRLDPPWPFNRRNKSHPGSDGGEAVAAGAPDAGADLGPAASTLSRAASLPAAVDHRSWSAPVRFLRGLLGPPAWVTRRLAVWPFDPEDFTT